MPDVDLSRSAVMEVCCRSDQLPDEKLANLVLAFAKAAQEPRLTVEEIENYYATITRRSVFVKNAPANAELFDLGAGDGALSVFRDWPSFKRDDIRMYAVSLGFQPKFVHYNEYKLLNFEETLPNFGGRPFDAIVCVRIS